MGGGCSSSRGGKVDDVNMTMKINSHSYQILLHNLNKQEIEGLRDSWPAAKRGWYEICTKAFGRWFTIYPEVKLKFGYQLADVSVEDIIASRPLLVHAKKSVNLIDELMGKVDDKHELARSLIELGKLHHKLGAEPKYATALGSSFVYAVMEFIPNADPDTVSAWNKLFKYLVGNLKLGMRIEAGEDMSQAKIDDIHADT